MSFRAGQGGKAAVGGQPSRSGQRSAISGQPERNLTTKGSKADEKK
jgi:hypothetical protein